MNLLGYTREEDEKLLVVEFMSNGTLHDNLHDSSFPMSWTMRVHLALQTAKGIFTLHSASPPIIHRDIKSSNVLIDEKWNAKLGDFGLALRGHIEDMVNTSTPPAGTMGYLDPEYSTPSDLSTKTDVFSFGILLLEIISGRNAIDLAYEPPSILDWALPLIKQGRMHEILDKKVPLPGNMKPVKQMITLATKCVRTSRHRRPSMFDVVEDLKETYRKVSATSFDGISRAVRCGMTSQRPWPGASARRAVMSSQVNHIRLLTQVTEKLSGKVADSTQQDGAAAETSAHEPSFNVFLGGDVVTNSCGSSISKLANAILLPPPFNVARKETLPASLLQVGSSSQTGASDGPVGTSQPGAGDGNSGTSHAGTSQIGAGDSIAESSRTDAGTSQTGAADGNPEASQDAPRYSSRLSTSYFTDCASEVESETALDDFKSANASFRSSSASAEELCEDEVSTSKTPHPAKSRSRVSTSRRPSTPLSPCISPGVSHELTVCNILGAEFLEDFARGDPLDCEFTQIQDLMTSQYDLVEHPVSRSSSRRSSSSVRSSQARLVELQNAQLKAMNDVFDRRKTFRADRDVSFRLSSTHESEVFSIPTEDNTPGGSRRTAAYVAIKTLATTCLGATLRPCVRLKEEDEVTTKPYIVGN